MRRHSTAGAAAGLALSVVMAACAGTNPLEPVPVDARLGEPFTLAPGQTAVLAEQQLSVSVDAVLDDSRCPIDTVCINAGDATIALGVQQTGRPGASLNLSLYESHPDTPVYEGFGIDARQLSPETRTDRTIPQTDYRVVLLVDRP